MVEQLSEIFSLIYIRQLTFLLGNFVFPFNELLDSISNLRYFLLIFSSNSALESNGSALGVSIADEKCKSNREYEAEQPSLCESIAMGVASSGLLSGSGTAPVNIPRTGLDRHPLSLTPSPPSLNLDTRMQNEQVKVEMSIEFLSLTKVLIPCFPLNLMLTIKLNDCSFRLEATATGYRFLITGEVLVLVAKDYQIRIYPIHPC